MSLHPSRCCHASNILWTFHWHVPCSAFQHMIADTVRTLRHCRTNQFGGDVSPKEHQELKSYVNHLYVIDSQQALFELSHRMEPRVWVLPPHRLTSPVMAALWAMGMSVPSMLLSCEERSCWVLSVYHKACIGKPTEVCSGSDISHQTQREASRTTVGTSRQRKSQKHSRMEKSGSAMWSQETNPLFNLRCAYIKTREHVLSYRDWLFDYKYALNMEEIYFA